MNKTWFIKKKSPVRSAINLKINAYWLVDAASRGLLLPFGLSWFVNHHHHHYQQNSYGLFPTCLPGQGLCSVLCLHPASRPVWEATYPCLLWACEGSRLKNMERDASLAPCCEGLRPAWGGQAGLTAGPCSVAPLTSPTDWFPEHRGVHRCQTSVVSAWCGLKGEISGGLWDRGA